MKVKLSNVIIFLTCILCTSAIFLAIFEKDLPLSETEIVTFFAFLVVIILGCIILYLIKEKEI